MASVRQVTEELIDDLDGTKAAETIKFAFDGQQYLIDLSKKNASGLRKALEPYVASARRTRATPARRPKASYDLAAVRAWAAEQGIEVAARGRVPQSVLEQYTANH